ncbi:MAG: cation:proton antiporter [Candidatus Micrarchaeales archaeon]
MVPISAITLSNSELLNIFSALAALLISAHIFGYLFSRFKLPRVIGEIVGGIVLGPTLLGFFFPSAYTFLFNAFGSEGQLIAIIYELGVILLMFVSGFEIQKSINKTDGKLIGALMLGSTIIPFVAAWLLFSSFNFSFLLGTQNNLLALQIVFATSVAITSIPVISKIFMDLGMTNTRFAKVVLGTATVHDTVLYVALAVATGLVSTTIISTYSILEVIVATILFFAISLLIIPRILQLINNSKYNLLRKSSAIGYMLFICFFFAALAVLLGVNIIFGAFLAGVAIGMMPKESFKAEKAAIKDISMALFIPLYFAVVGLQLDLIHNFDIPFFVAFLVASTIIAMIGTLFAAKISKLNWSSSLNLAVVINARGGPGIVLATVAFGLGIINENFFVTLVMSAIFTSFIAGWWLRFRSQNKQELLVMPSPN